MPSNYLTIGIIVDESETGEFNTLLHKIIGHLQKQLKKNFPQFKWVFSFLKRKDFPTSIPLDPLELLEFGASLKLDYNLDFALVFTSLPLKSRFNQIVNAVPSNMLETAVISMARIIEEDTNKQVHGLLALCKHVLGHLWGLEHNANSVMQPHHIWTSAHKLSWSKEEKKHILSYLKDIADPRLEETSKGLKLSAFLFYLHVLKREGISILRDILLFRSWLMMLRLGKFTVATAISIIFLFLSAEAWEMGAAICPFWLNIGIGIILLAATLSLYFGQNLHKVAKSEKIKEQSVRSKLVLFGTLFIGITIFWLNLFLISTIIIYLLPQKILVGWAGIKNNLPIFHFGKIMATFGILASALGGNLEEAQDIKAVLFYTEET
ncbi:hypothetical protein [Desulfonauticus submarinus]